jgi:hypothetical protein
MSKWRCPGAYLVQHYAMKTYGGVEALDEGEWIDSRPSRFTPRATGTRLLLDRTMDGAINNILLPLPGIEL